VQDTFNPFLNTFLIIFESCFPPQHIIIIIIIIIISECLTNGVRAYFVGGKEVYMVFKATVIVRN